MVLSGANGTAIRAKSSDLDHLTLGEKSHCAGSALNCIVDLRVIHFSCRTTTLTNEELAGMTFIRMSTTNESIHRFDPVN